MSTAEDWATPATSDAAEKIVNPVRKHPSSSEQVGHPAAEEKESSEHQPVGDDHPLQRALADVQVLLDGRQRHVHDRDVEHDHELGGARQRQDRCRGGSAMWWCP